MIIILQLCYFFLHLTLFVIICNKYIVAFKNTLQNKVLFSSSVFNFSFFVLFLDR